MKKFKGLLSVILFGLTVGAVFTACNMNACSIKGCSTGQCAHDYKIIDSAEATCSDDGWLTYECSKCGNGYTEPLEAKGHVAGADATETQTQVCTVCGVVLQDENNDYTLVKKTARALPINYLNGSGASEYFETRIDTQSHGRYKLPEVTYFKDDKAQNALPFQASVPVQEFYTHDILSVYGLTTDDGKAFLTQSGFKVRFDIDAVDCDVRGLTAYEGFSQDFVSPADLHIVRTYPAPANFGKIYEIIDFSDSYIEVARQTGLVYTAVSKQTLSELNGENQSLSGVEISDGGKLFMECGTYRVMFKYSMAWASDPIAAVYDKNGNACCPYGTIKDRYDYFYITVGNEKANLLLPYTEPDGGKEPANAADEAFYQLRANSVEKDKLYFAPESVIEFGEGENVKLSIDTLLDYKNGERYFKGDKLQSFTIGIYVCGETQEEESLYADFDLKSTALGLVESADIQIPKDNGLSGRRLKIVVRSGFSKAGAAEEITSEQVYFASFVW